jgi:arylsulfatase A-like enzyme
MNQPNTVKPNILFFFTDDQRFDTIAALGSPLVKTPNIDALVHRGTAFTQAHIPCGTVGAVCMPSRAMLHTGRNLFHLHQDGAAIPESHALLGETLQKAGYRTFGTGKWHNGTSSYARSFSDGGEIFFGGMNDHWNVPAYYFDPTGQYSQRANRIDNPFFSNRVTQNICDHITPGKHSSALFCDCAADWLEAYDQDAPFFMYVSFMAPHDPRSVPEPFQSLYDPDLIPLPENYAPEHDFDFGIRAIRDEVLAPYPRSPQEIKKHIAEYYSMISHLDDEMGKVLAVLNKKGLLENTIIILAGDNGLALGQHGLMGKQSNYEHSVRVPLIFAGPGIPQHETRAAYAYLLDIYPTLCDLLGIEIPASVEGISLVPVLADPRAVIRPSLYFAYADLVRSVKHGHYKLIEYRSPVGLTRTQLFDLVSDPLETQNLAGQEEWAKVETSLRAELIRWRDDWDDPLHPRGQEFWSRF